MPSLSLSLSLNAVRGAGGGSLDFSALTALPTAQESTVTTNAELAASDATTETGSTVTAQDVVDALAVGRGMSILLPGWGCLLDASGGSEVAQGAAVGAIRSLTDIELAAQGNASLQPASAADGVYADGTDVMSLGDLSAWAEGEMLFVRDTNFSGLDARTLGEVGTATNNGWMSPVRAGDNRIFDSFGTTASNLRVTGPTTLENKGIYQTWITTTGSKVIRWQGTTLYSGGGEIVSFSSAGSIMDGIGALPDIATWSAIALNSSLYTTAQRSALKHFLKHLLSISGVS